MIKQVCSEMLEQRGYNITQSDEFLIGQKDEQNIIAFIKPSKLSILKLKEYITLMGEHKLDHAIIVCTEITPPARTAALSSKVIQLELFMNYELQYNITKHRFVPAHRRLTNNEVAAFKKTFVGNLPKLLYGKPIQKFYDYKRGDIIEITRNTGDMKEIVYRIVK